MPLTLSEGRYLTPNPEAKEKKRENTLLSFAIRNFSRQEVWICPTVWLNHNWWNVDVLFIFFVSLARLKFFVSSELRHLHGEVCSSVEINSAACFCAKMEDKRWSMVWDRARSTTSRCCSVEVAPIYEIRVTSTTLGPRSIKYAFALPHHST